MKKNCFIWGFFIFILGLHARLTHASDENIITADADKILQKNSRLFFIENKGQWHEDVLYLCRMGGLDAWITKYGVNYTFYRIERKKSPDEKESVMLPGKFDHEEWENSVLLGHRVLFELQGYNPNPMAEGRHKQAGYHNYFIGNDPSKHATHVGLYGEVVVKDVYPGIDMRYYFDEGYLRFDFLVHPGADPNRIKFRLKGADDAYLKSSKKLAFTTRFGEAVMADLRTCQEGREVESRFERKGNDWRVATGKYDIKKPLIIDPLIYSTYIGGTNTDVGRAIKVNALGTAYICGSNINGGYDVVVGSYDIVHNGLHDVVVTMIPPGGGALNNSTYLGGSHSETSSDIFIDSSTGDVYVVGVTSSTNFPVTGSAFQITHGNNNDGFITKFNSSLTSLIYSSFIGGSGQDGVTSVFVNNSGEAYLTGYTNSSNFTVTPSPIIQSNLNGSSDIFVSKVNSTGSAVLLSTYIGGTNVDEANSIKIDNSGNVYVAGKTLSTNFPMVNPIQSVNNGSFDVVLCKINPTFSALLISTYLGGSNADICYDMDINSSNEIYLTGVTASSNFTTTVGCYDASYNGGSNDCFLTKLNSNGSVSFSTFFGGLASEEALGIELDALNNIYITGYTSSNNFPVQFAYQATKSTSLSSEMDAFVLKFNPLGNTLLYSTFLGGTADEVSWDITLGNMSNAYITGQTNSTDFDVVNFFQSTNGGGYDVFVTNLCMEPLPSFSLTSSPANTNQTLCVNGGLTPVTFSAANSSTAAFSGLPPGVNGSYNSGSITISGSPTVTGNYVYSVNIMNGCAVTTTTGILNVIPGPQYGTVNTSGNPSQSVCINQSITPITYSFSGALSASVGGLPDGISYNSSPMSPQIQIAGTPTQSGVYVYTVTLVGAQCNSTFTETIHVLPPLSHTLLSSSSSTNQNVCAGASIQPITYTTAGLTSVTYSGLPAGVTFSQNAGQITISGTPTVSGNYSFVIGMNGACGSQTNSGFINVVPQPTFTTTGGGLFQNVCAGSGIQTITINTHSLLTVTVTGLPAGVNFNSNTNGGMITGTPALPAPQNEFTITVQNACGQYQQTGTIVVNSGNAAAVQISPPGTESQTVCLGQGILPISYSISGVSSVSVTGLPAGIGYFLTPGVCSIAGTPSISGTFPFQMTVYGCGSSNAVKEGTLDVLPLINMTLTGSPSLNSQTVCLGRPILEIEYKITGNPVNTLQVWGLAGGLEYDFDSDDQEVKIEGTPNAAGVYVYTVTTPGACLENSIGEIRVETCTQLNIPTGIAGGGVWYIENIEQYPDNEVYIFGRWGNKIAYIKGYNNQDKAWGSTQFPINVPEGTYYYVISLKDKKIKGYVELLN